MPNERIPPCTCGWLEGQANEANSPIRFDRSLNEYHIVCEGERLLCIYHCPFCGGRAPESKRDLMFAHIDHKECTRLTQLTYRLGSVQDVIAELGQPDEDSYASTTTPERDGKPETVEVHRQLVYRQLSAVADLWVLVYPGDCVSTTFQGKYTGLPEDRSQ
jgi:hypothetical protein